MAGSGTKFEQFLAEELQKYKGIAYPVKTGWLRRKFTHHAPCQKLHPNPSDEFCDPQIGPNYEIIQRYCAEIQKAQRFALPEIFPEPLTVERMRPDGYLLLNGHHRWAAACRQSVEKLPIEIVNPTTERDLNKMIQNATHHKRVSMDLDEVIFSGGAENAYEKPLRFPMNRIFTQRLRRGVPALIYFFQNNGYDVWVYSHEYHSLDAVRGLFSCYRVHLDGIVTGMVANRPGMEKMREQLAEMNKKQYPKTVHVDGHSIMCIDREAGKFQEFELSGSAETWSQEVLNCMEAYEKHERA